MLPTPFGARPTRYGAKYVIVPRSLSHRKIPSVSFRVASSPLSRPPLTANLSLGENAKSWMILKAEEMCSSGLHGPQASAVQEDLLAASVHRRAFEGRTRSDRSERLLRRGNRFFGPD